jgi:hypothetical protein
MIGKAGIIYVIGFALILGTIGWNMSRYSVSTTGNMEAYVDGAVSHNLALAGANLAMAKFYNNHGWSGDISQNFNLPGLKGSAEISLSTSGTTAILSSISTYSTWWVGGGAIHDTIRVFFDINDTSSFALYAWYTGFSGNDQFWYGGDSVWGTIRSNGGLHMGSGTEVFNGRVMLAKNITGPGKPVYLQGPPVKTVGVPLPSDLSSVSSAAGSGGKVYTGNLDVKFVQGTGAAGDGSVVFRNSATKALVDSFALGASGFNGAVWVNGDVHVTGGKVDGKVSIGSSNDIFIQGGGIRYEQDPLLGASVDVLGLIATNNVTIGLNASTYDPANWPNCRIDAAMFALKGGFNALTPGGTGLLTVTGSIIEGSKGSIMGANGNDGYIKRYHWDARFATSTYRPPFFPGFGPKTYKITNWWESPRRRAPLNS